MTRPFSVHLYTTHDLADAENAARLWKLLDSPLIKPARFDSVEKAKRKFTADGGKAACKIFDDERFLFVQGANDGFRASFSVRSAGLFGWHVHLDPAAVDGKQGSSWLDWIHVLCGEFPVLFGFGCTAEEHDAKHHLVRKLPSGMVERKWVGVSDAEFQRYLPGIYWLTLFGAELVQTFGEAKLLKLANVKSQKLDGGQVSIRLDDAAVTTHLDTRLAVEEKIADQVGAEYFFHRDRDAARLRPAPKLLASLKKIAAAAG